MGREAPNDGLPSDRGRCRPGCRARERRRSPTGRRMRERVRAGRTKVRRAASALLGPGRSAQIVQPKPASPNRPAQVGQARGGPRGEAAAQMRTARARGARAGRGSTGVNATAARVSTTGAGANATWQWSEQNGQGAGWPGAWWPSGPRARPSSAPAAWQMGKEATSADGRSAPTVQAAAAESWTTSPRTTSHAITNPRAAARALDVAMRRPASVRALLVRLAAIDAWVRGCGTPDTAHGDRGFARGAARIGRDGRGTSQRAPARLNKVK